MIRIVGAIAALVLAGTAHADVAETKARKAVDEAVATSSKSINCGKKIAVKYDWSAFDKINWSKIGADKKKNALDYEALSQAYVGSDLNGLCADADYKAALGKISTIVIKAVYEEGAAIKATVSGSTMTLTNSVHNSRGPGEWDTAIRAAL